MEEKEKLPPRFSPDNSPEARARRMRGFVLPKKVMELPHPYVCAEPEGYEDNVVRLPLRFPPDDICA